MKIKEILWYNVFHSVYLENLALRVAFPLGIAERKVLFLYYIHIPSSATHPNPITEHINWNPGFVKYVHSLSPFALASDNKQYGFICLPPFSLGKKKVLHFFHQNLLELFSQWPFWDEKKRSHISCLSITPGTVKMDCAMKKGKKQR